MVTHAGHGHPCLVDRNGPTEAIQASSPYGTARRLRGKYAESMEYVCNVCGICNGICVEYVWDMHGICVEDVWDMYGICMGLIWNMYVICTECVWNILYMYGTCVEYVWNMGIRME